MTILIILILAFFAFYLIGPSKNDSYDQDWHDRMNDL